MRAQFIRYFITGCSAFCLDIGLLYVLKEYVHMRPFLAIVVYQIFVLSYIFLLNKYWSFKARGVTRKQLIRFMVVAVANYLIAIAWMWFFNEKMQIYYLLSRIANVSLSVVWNFFLYRYWVYKYQLEPVIAPANPEQTM